MSTIKYFNPKLFWLDVITRIPKPSTTLNKSSNKDNTIFLKIFPFIYLFFIFQYLSLSQFFPEVWTGILMATLSFAKKKKTEITSR